MYITGNGVLFGGEGTQSPPKDTAHVHDDPHQPLRSYLTGPGMSSQQPAKRKGVDPEWLAKIQDLTNFEKNPLKVSNVQGSTAGAGSGEFHKYRKMRGRETARLARMDQEVREVEEKERFLAERKAVEDELALKTEKRAAKRRRKKEAKRKGMEEAAKSVE